MVGRKRKVEGGEEEDGEGSKRRKSSRASSTPIGRYEDESGNEEDSKKRSYRSSASSVWREEADDTVEDSDSDRLEDSFHTEVKLEPDVTLVPDGEVVARIRRLKPGESSEFHASMKLGWVQLCPFCQKEVGTLVDHVKGHHPEREYRMIRTRCPYVECAKLVVDIKNHIRMVHKKIKNYGCDECDALFVNNYQVRKHKEGVHCGTVRVKCEECDLMLKSTTLENHVKRVHRGMKPSLPCSECEKEFGSKADLERHVLGKHMKWKAPCPECGKKFRMECLHQHIMTVHNGIYPFQCPHCEQGFQNQKNLGTHVRTKHQGVYLYCRLVTTKGLECGKVLLSEEGLIKHIECKHLGGEGGLISECPQCLNQISSCYLAEHLRREHLGDGGLVCPVETCGDVCSARDDVRRHVVTVHGELELEWCQDCEEVVLELGEHRKIRHEAGLWKGNEFRPLYGVVLGTRCHHEGCDFMATGPTHLARHVKIRHEVRVSVKCDLCGKKTFNMDRHVRIQHEKEKTLKCEYCDQKFVTPFTLKKHQLTHTALEERTQPCPKCGADVLNMKQHDRFVHQKDLPYGCEEEGCVTRFTSLLHMKNHMESVHEKVKIGCPQCGKMIGTGSLRSHVKIVHEKRRDYICPECEKTFQNKSHLRNHVQRVHLNMREECPDCGKMVQDLHNHRTFVHLKVKNFPCELCDTRCTTSTALRKHISSVHKEEKQECPECGDSVKHLEQHMKQRHSDVKKFYQCAECEKFFTCGSYLSKHIMRVHLEMRETCPSCGLETKDLHRHKKTNCSKEGYTPRQRKLKKEREEQDDNRMEITPMKSVRSSRVLRTKEIKTEMYNEDSDGEFDFLELAQKLEPGIITGDVSRRNSIRSDFGELEVEEPEEEDPKEDLVRVSPVLEESPSSPLVSEEDLPSSLVLEDSPLSPLVTSPSPFVLKESQPGPLILEESSSSGLVLEDSPPSPLVLEDDDLFFKRETDSPLSARVGAVGCSNNNAKGGGEQVTMLF